MARALPVVLVLIASVAGGLIGLQVAPEVWFVLDDIGVVATPTCNDVVIGTVSALCARPLSMEIAALATAALCAAAAGFVTLRMLRTAAARPPEHDQGA